MNVVVLGATGHIGNAVVRELLSRGGYAVTCTGRRSAPPSNLAGLAVRYAPGDQDRPGQIDAWVSGNQIVIDAAAPYPTRLFEPTNDPHIPATAYAVHRTRELIDAARRHDATLAYVSSFTTLKRRRGGFEEWPAQMALRLHPYFAVKQIIEDEILEATRFGLRAVIVNPTMCFGPWDIRDRELTLIPRLLTGEVPGSVRHNLNVLDVREVAAGLVAALEARRYGTPMLFSGHNMSAQALFRWICEIGGVPPPPISAPTSITAFGSYWLEAMFGLAGLQTPINSLAPLLMYQHEWMPPCTALRDLGVTVRPLYESLLDSVNWYRSIGYF